MKTNETYIFIISLLTFVIFLLTVCVITANERPERTETKAKIEESSETEEPTEESTTEPEPTETEEPTEESEEEPEITITICGKTLAPEIAEYLYRRLTDYGIEQWMPYACAQMFQESGFDPRAENRNGLDKGILQYRITYWNGSDGSIFDYKAQIDRYVKETERRLNVYGCSIWETISRHKTSDYGSYDQVYVDQVMQWIAEE